MNLNKKFEEQQIKIKKIKELLNKN